MDESKKNLLVTLEGASGLYGDLRGRILSVESELGAGIVEIENNLANNYKSNVELSTVLATKADLVNNRIPASQLPSYVDDVLEHDSLSEFPTTGEKGKVYVALDTNIFYRWSGSTYISLVDIDFSNYYTKDEVYDKTYINNNMLTSSNIATYDGSGTADTDIVKMMMAVKNSLSTNPT